jgi:hypothetical protein
VQSLPENLHRTHHDRSQGFLHSLVPLLELLDMPPAIAHRLLAWQDLRLGARLDGTNLVIEALGTRR